MYLKELIQSKIDSFKADPDFRDNKERADTLAAFESSLNTDVNGKDAEFEEWLRKKN